VERHIDLLRTLATLWGALAMLVGVSMLMLAAGALAELFAPAANRVDVAASLTAAMFVFLGVFALVWGGAHVWAAVLMKRRRPLGRVLSLALAIVNLLVLPFGTAFGAYALWVLLRDDGRRLFEPAR
jgi:hypothetical protein